MGFLSDFFEMLSELLEPAPAAPAEPAQPEERVAYKLHLGLKPCELTFKYKKGYWGEGTKYTLNGKEYTDIKSFCGPELEKLTDDVSIREDIYKNKVLNCYQSIPIFDSEDAEYDSAQDEFLMFDGKDINLVACRHGYRLSSFTVYGCLTQAPTILKPYFVKMGFPVDGIKWDNVAVKDSKLQIYHNR